MTGAVRLGFVVGLAVVAAFAFFLWREGRLPNFADAPERAAPPPSAALDQKRGPVEPAPPPASGAPSGREPDASQAPSGPAGGQGAPNQSPAPGSGPGAAARPQNGAAATSPDASTPPKPQASRKAEDKGAFDVVRVEPSGDMVVAGRCAAGCKAELLANGAPHDVAVADAQGMFTMVPKPLPPGDYELALKTTGANGAEATSEQTVTVSVPKPPAKDVVVVLNEPDAASRVLQAPGAAPPPPAAQAARTPVPDAAPRQRQAALAIVAVDAEAGRFFAQGTAPVGAKLRIYLNNALLAEPTAGADGRWSLKVGRGLGPGAYVVRVDQIGAGARVLARVEARFTYAAEVAAAGAKPKDGPTRHGGATGAAAPGAPAAPGGPAPARLPAATPGTAAGGPAGGASAGSAAKPETAAGPDSSGAASTESAAQTGAGGPVVAGEAPVAQSPAAAPDEGAPADSAAAGGAADRQANPEIASIDTVTVRRGDSLWRISRGAYGAGKRFTVIFEANDGQIRNPDLIYPGQVFVLPAQSGDASAR